MLLIPPRLRLVTGIERCAFAFLLASIVLCLWGCGAEVKMDGGSSTVSRDVVEPETTTTVKEEWSR